MPKRSAEMSHENRLQSLVYPLKCVSLYTGAGGLDLGFEAAGFQTRVAVENDVDAASTLRANRPAWEIVQQDIHSEHASSAELLRLAKIQVGEADILIGGPPCQPYSKSGYWANGDSKRLGDPRASTLTEYLRVLRDLQPRAFLLENVPGFAFSNKDEGVVFLRRSIEAINREIGTRYSVEVALLRAVEHGVPQDRERVFVVGSRDGASFVFPRPRFSIPERFKAQQGESIEDSELRLGMPELEHFYSAWDAIGDLQDDDDRTLRLTGKWADLLPSIPEGRNYLFHTDRDHGKSLFGWRRRYWSFLLKLAKRLPSWTIAASPGPAIGPFHWKNRRLSVRELMRLQTFPDDYQIAGSLRSAQRQLGNAVPAVLAERLARLIRRQLLNDVSTDTNRLTLLPIRRSGMPSAEIPTEVPVRYLSLDGYHEAHPGTGLGYSARRRA